MMCFIGQQMVFQEAEDTLKALKGIEINAKQIERVCHHYGGMISSQEDQMMEEHPCHIYEGTESNKRHYAMLDGAMYLTREEKWKEAKIGRIFKEDDNVEITRNRAIISESMYVAHLGSHHEFLPKMEYYLDDLKSLIIIADGAKWIWNWADTFYPDATQILDFYHAKEHLCNFAVNYFKDSEKRESWIENQCRMLLEEDVGKVIDELEKLPASANNKLEKQKKNLMGYYKQNRKRMSYNVFLKRGLLIGSGAIESAHRNVLQQRMKLSGQRWTIEGFKQIACLRVVYKSNNWNKITDLTKKAA